MTTLKEIRQLVRQADANADTFALEADQYLSMRAQCLREAESARSDEEREEREQGAQEALTRAREAASESVSVRSSVDRERSALAAVSASRRVVRQRLAERMRTVRALFSE